MSSGEPLQGDERRHETWRDEEEKGSVRHAIECACSQQDGKLRSGPLLKRSRRLEDVIPASRILTAFSQGIPV